MEGDKNLALGYHDAKDAIFCILCINVYSFDWIAIYLQQHIWKLKEPFLNEMQLRLSWISLILRDADTLVICKKNSDTHTHTCIVKKKNSVS